jgi:Tfx family DNA-binding protein
MVEREGGTPVADGGSVHGFDADGFLSDVGFDEDAALLTRRQAKVLVMRERGFKQAAIAEKLGTSRANVSGIEASGRENIEQAKETVAFAKLLSAPVRVEVPSDTDLYDLPDLVFDACDEADLKVAYTAPDLMKLISDAADDAIEGREVKERLVVSVTTDGEIQVRTP